MNEDSTMTEGTYPIPSFEEEGFWWARWLKADPGTDDGGVSADGSKWEPVEVFANVILPDNPGDWRVLVLGVSKSQSVENFEWGSPIARSTPGEGAIRADEREKIASALSDEADTTPDSEDATVVRDCARLVRASFSYDEAERLADATPAEPDVVSPGAEAIAAERTRQVQQEGWSPEHDDEHDAGEIAGAGAAYALNAACLLSPYHGTPLDEPPDSWLWERMWWKPNMGDDPRRDLVKAGALIAAEIDRLDRENSPS